MFSYAKKAKELFRVCLNTALTDQMVKYNCAVRAKLPRVSHKKVIIPMPGQIGEMLRLTELTDTYLEFLLAIT